MDLKLHGEKPGLAHDATGSRLLKVSRLLHIQMLTMQFSKSQICIKPSHAEFSCRYIALDVKLVHFQVYIGKKNKCIFSPFLCHPVALRTPQKRCASWTE